MRILSKRVFLCSLWLISVIVGDITNVFALTLNVITVAPAINVTAFRLINSLPYDRQSVTTIPQTVSFSFTQPPDKDHSYIKVLDMNGTRVDSGEVVADGTMLYTVTDDLLPGRYTVKWNIQCLCAEQTELNDIFHFTIK